MVYYELFGLPGAGKSTIVTPVVTRLRANGFSVATKEDIYHAKGLAGNKIIFILELLLSLREYWLYFGILSLYLQENKNLSGIRYAIRSIVFVHQTLQTRNKKYDVVLCDEGIIQYLASISYTTEMHKGKTLTNVADKIKKKVSLHVSECKLDKEECLHRINLRSSQSSKRYNSSINSDTLLHLLDIRHKNLRLISSLFNDYQKLDMSQPVNENIEKLYKSVTDLLV